MKPFINTNECKRNILHATTPFHSSDVFKLMSMLILDIEQRPYKEIRERLLSLKNMGDINESKNGMKITEWGMR